MAVLVEGISVILKASSITSKFPGGWQGFKEAVPNNTLCADSEVVRVGFMSPEDVESFVRKMEEYGFSYQHEGEAEDLVVVDQIKGPMVPCDWIEFGKVDWQDDPQKKVVVCFMIGTKIDQVLTPDGWEYDRSLSKHFTFVPTNERYEKTVFIENRDGNEVHIDLATGKEVYRGRAKG